MKEITYNLLSCNKKGCADSNKNYPFIIKAEKIINIENPFDIEKTKMLYEKQDKIALNQFCNDLNLSKYDFTKIDEETIKQNEFWENVHKILNCVTIETGVCICPNCKREYPIKQGIVDMILQDTEF